MSRKGGEAFGEAQDNPWAALFRRLRLDSRGGCPHIVILRRPKRGDYELLVGAPSGVPPRTFISSFRSFPDTTPALACGWRMRVYLRLGHTADRCWSPAGRSGCVRPHVNLFLKKVPRLNRRRKFVLRSAAGEESPVSVDGEGQRSAGAASGSRSHHSDSRRAGSLNISARYGSCKSRAADVLGCEFCGVPVDGGG